MKNKKNKRRRKIRINRLIMLFLFAFMLCFGLVIFIKSDFFSLKYVKVINNNMLTKSEINKLSSISIGKNIFTYDLKKIKSNIEASPYIKSISIKRKIPNSLVINVEEKNIMCVLKDKNQNYYYVDKDLVYIDKINEVDIEEKYPIISADFYVDNRQINFKNKNDKKYLSSLMENIENQGLNKKVCEIDFLKKDTIDINLDKKMEVVVLKDDNIDYNISKLTRILMDLNGQNIYYGKIDMTFSKYTLYTYKR